MSIIDLHDVISKAKVEYEKEINNIEEKLNQKIREKKKDVLNVYVYGELEEENIDVSIQFITNKTIYISILLNEDSEEEEEEDNKELIDIIKEVIYG